MHSEEIEVQTKIAELQADIQIYLAISIGFFATAVAVLAIFFQVFMSKDVVWVSGLIVAESILAVGSMWTFRKVDAVRKELGKLREKYTW